jgi:hypothetical protein
LEDFLELTSLEFGLDGASGHSDNFQAVQRQPVRTAGLFDEQVPMWAAQFEAATVVDDATCSVAFSTAACPW